MTDSVPFLKTDVGVDEASAVFEAIMGGHLATGKIVEDFEAAISRAYGYNHVVVVNSGTTALTLAMIAMGVGMGDEVITTPYTVVATANAIVATGADPVFADIDRRTYNLDVASIERLLTENTKVIIPVDAFGVVAPVEEIKAMLVANDREDIHILSDSMEAMGAQYADGSYVGSKSSGGTFGFFPNKQICTCHGGVFYTNDGELATKVRKLRHHGFLTGGLEAQAFGFNVRMSDPLAAMGIVQLEKLPQKQENLRKVVGYYQEHLPLPMQLTPEGTVKSEFIMAVEVHGGRDNIASQLAEVGIPTRPYFVPLIKLDHLKYHTTDNGCPVALEVANRTLALPFYPDMTEDEVILVCNRVSNLLKLEK